MTADDITLAINRSIDSLTAAEYQAHAGAWMPVLRHVGNFSVQFQEWVADAIQEAYNAGATKKAICDALGMPIGTLRGLQKGVTTG